MPFSGRFGASFRVSPSYLILIAFLIVLGLAGGASRADVLGQAVVRGGAWVSLIGACLFSPRPSLGSSRIVATFMIAIVAIMTLQLVPLPPVLWQSLGGRGLFSEAAAIVGGAQPWRPLSISPSATFNALSSLVVPAALLVLVAGLRAEERSYLPRLTLLFVLAAALIGLVQVSGGILDNPLINDSPGEVSGPFANRNHFALLLSFGCVLAPVWAFRDGRDRPSWRIPAALGLLLMFTLLIVVIGSRSGLLVGVIGLLLGLAIVFPALRQMLDGYPRWVLFASAAGVVGTLAILVLLSFAADRADSIQRAISLDPAYDMRARGFPTVLAMIRTYFPWGIGFGAFDAAFRIAEPFTLLKPTYFNHAHDDFLEVVLEAGLPGLVLLASALGAAAWYGVAAWRAGGGMRHAIPKMGAAMLLQISIASAFDYPVRTPVIMAITILAALWLTEGSLPKRMALPRRGRHL